jgi:tRNA(fMet)-specific endonuclease VapC
MYLLDSSVCIAFMRGDVKVQQRVFDFEPSELMFSIVSLFEIQVGIEKSKTPELLTKKRLRLSALRDIFGTFAFGERESSEAAKVRVELESLGKSIGPYDLLIAGTARANGLTIVTGNVKEFSRVKNLKLENWHE